MTTATAAVGERHLSIDAVRGFAVLGILLMNIVGMGLPSFAYVDPTYAGGSEGADLWTWAINNVLVDGKMRALFSMLFGASAILIAERAEQAPPGAAQTHYRRLLWLLPFGVVHAVFFWFGDILTVYAVAGLFIFPFRRLTPWVQIAIGATILVLLLAQNVGQAQALQALRAAATAPDASASAVDAWREASALVQPPAGAKAAELAGFGGGFVSATMARLDLLRTYLGGFLLSGVPEAAGLMFVGMGLFRLGFFTLRWPNRAYAALIVFGYAVCAPLTAWLAWLIWRSGFELLALHELQAWQQTTQPFIALAHAGALLLLIRAGWLEGLTDRLAAAGRMAFSNYLLTSVITSLVFCGYGLGLYGELSRAELMWIVLGVWAFILAWSRPWLRRFRYGPFEWAWRSLVQWKPQPFVRSRREASASAAQG